MKFSASLSDFLKALTKTLPAMPRKSTLPVLEHLHFSLKDNTLQIVATDQDITIQTNLEVTGGEDGSVLVPGRKLNDITKALGEYGSFEFTSNNETFDIHIATNFGKYHMKGLNPTEYLDLPELFKTEKPVIETAQEGFEPGSQNPYVLFNRNEIVKIAEKTIFAVSNDEFRPAMTGVLLQTRENVANAVSTDSFRLVKVTVNLAQNTYTNYMDLIIPARAIELLRRADTDVIMTVVETQGSITHVRFDIGETLFITKIIDEKFPPYEAVIPKNNELVAAVAQKELLAAIKRVSIFTSAISHQVKLIIDGNALTITGEDEESGNQANETVNCDYNGQHLEIAFNYKYIEEALQNIDANGDSPLVYLTFSEANRPALIKPTLENEEILMLVMPVRL